MAGSINEVTLMGRVGRDPEIVTTNGTHFAKFSLCTGDKYTNADGKEINTEQWHNVVVWILQAITFIENYVKKGAGLYMRGELQTRKWEGKDGIKRYATEVVVRSFGKHFVTFPVSNKRNDEPAPAASLPPETSSQASPSNSGSTLLPPADDGLDDEIPF